MVENHHIRMVNTVTIYLNTKTKTIDSKLEHFINDLPIKTIQILHLNNYTEAISYLVRTLMFHNEKPKPSC